MRAYQHRSGLAACAAVGLTLTITFTAGADWRNDRRAGGSDEVLDNRASSRDADRFESDDPFAYSKPDPVARREDGWKPGLGGSIGLGWAFADGLFMKNRVHGQTFMAGDLGWWAIPHLFIGGQLSAGYVLQDCEEFDGCSGWNLRGGPEIVARLLPFQQVTPWFGVATGLEFLWLNRSSEAFDEKISARGFELVNLRLGVDLHKNGHYLGVYASYSIAKYQEVDYRLADNTGATIASGSGSEATRHGWLSFGVRGSLE